MSPRVAIIYSFNDLEFHRMGSRKGIKEKISYFNQFLVSRQSILDEWKSNEFSYEFYVVHSLDFDLEKEKYLESLGVKLIKVDMEKIPFLRVFTFLVDIDCDYRLVLDNDTFATSQVKFNFGSDAYAAFGGCKYNPTVVTQMCKRLDLKRPQQDPINKERPQWNAFEYKQFYTSDDFSDIFPYFNGGAVMVKNTFSKKFGELMKDSTPEMIKFAKAKSISLSFQDFFGICINHLTDNWSPFPKGFNYIINLNIPDIRHVIDSYEGQISLIHYINCGKKCKYYESILNTFNKVEYKE